MGAGICIPPSEWGGPIMTRSTTAIVGLTAGVAALLAAMVLILMDSASTRPAPTANTPAVGPPTARPTSIPTVRPDDDTGTWPPTVAPPSVPTQTPQNPREPSEAQAQPRTPVEIVAGPCVREPSQPNQFVVEAWTCPGAAGAGDAERTVQVWRLTDAAYGLQGLCGPGESCSGAPQSWERPNGLSGHERSGTTRDGQSFVRWSYQQESWVFTVVSEEKARQLHLWWQNQSLQLSGV